MKKQLGVFALLGILLMMPMAMAATIGHTSEITLTGNNPQTIDYPNTYIELGATATDFEDGDLTSAIVIDISALNLNELGTYVVKYSVTDSDGNVATAYRNVQVINSATAGLVSEPTHSSRSSPLDSKGPYSLTKAHLDYLYSKMDKSFVDKLQGTIYYVWGNGRGYHSTSGLNGGTLEEYNKFYPNAVVMTGGTCLNCPK